MFVVQLIELLRLVDVVEMRLLQLLFHFLDVIDRWLVLVADSGTTLIEWCQSLTVCKSVERDYNLLASTQQKPCSKCLGQDT